MSLYNMLFGVNPHAPMLLGFLGTTSDQIPRFRDCYVEDGKIAVHTRMGGGNRGHWDYSDSEEGPDCDCPGCHAENYLPTLPGYLYDEDDDFDCTYATYYYRPNEDVAKLVEQLSALGPESPADRWQKLFADMKAGKDNPQIARAVEVCKPLIDSISTALAAGTRSDETPSAAQSEGCQSGGDSRNAPEQPR